MAGAGIVVEYLGSFGKSAVVVHGGAGAWRIRGGEASRIIEVVEAAARKGLQAITESPLQAIVEAIIVLEDSGVFNAGIGSVLNYNGELEMDAGLMDGAGRAAGVAITRYPKNPILLAYRVMEAFDHVIIGGEGADRIAERLGLEPHPGPSQRAIERWRKALEKIKENGGRLSWAKKIMAFYSDTVGAVAVKEGIVAAGTSTGGVILKHPGRIGDSPIPGAGFYAVNGVGACAATGIGETIILGRPCIYAVELLSNNVPVEEAARAAVARHTRVYGGDNLGIILVDARGEAAAAINTEAMPVAAAGQEKVISKIIGLD